MSRLIESWKQSGWEYRFYSDEASASFIETHFPPEVLEAYNSITPGAFKADLFRYCTLLINGGVYADMDVLLEANLDAVISADAGFIVPVDQVRHFLVPPLSFFCFLLNLILCVPFVTYLDLFPQSPPLHTKIARHRSQSSDLPLERAYSGCAGSSFPCQGY